MFIFVFIWKIIKMIANLAIKLIVWFGLWVPVLFSVAFVLYVGYKHIPWEAAQLWFYIGLIVSCIFGFMWFVRFSLKIKKRDKKKKK